MATVLHFGARTFSHGGRDLPYRSYRPPQPGVYPLIVSLCGSYGIGTDNVHQIENVTVAWNYEHGSYATEFPAIVIAPQPAYCAELPAPYYAGGPLGAPEPTFHPDWPEVNADGWFASATIALVASLTAPLPGDRDADGDVDDRDVADVVGHYGLTTNDRDVADVVGYYGFAEVLGDASRVYLCGHSLGGKAVFELLWKRPDLWAAAIVSDGWAIGQARYKWTTTSLNTTLSARLRAELAASVAVPLYLRGGTDGWVPGLKAVAKCRNELGNPCDLKVYSTLNHELTATTTWANKELMRAMLAQKRAS